jgi:signal transduction histidine kinase/DNA-binding response OmpR family regulator
MPVVYELFQKIRSMRSLFLQLLFVALAFILMVLSSSLYVRKMLHNHLNRDAVEMLTQTKLKIEAELAGYENTLTAISGTIRGMILRGNPEFAVQEFMWDIVNELQQKAETDRSVFYHLSGYFEAFGGKYLYAPEKEIPEGYNPVEQLWYKTAVEAGGKIAITPIYPGLHADDQSITYVCRIFDEKGKPLAAIRLSIPLDSIKNYVADMRVTKSSYGIFMDEKLNIFYYPNPDIVGKNAQEIKGGFSLLSDEILGGNNVVEREVKNYKDELIIAFSTRIENGWVLCNVIPKAEYYSELYMMLRILIILGTGLASVLIAILIRVDRTKNKLDDENRRKSILLATIEAEREADEITQLMLDAMPLCCMLWDEKNNLTSCNEETKKLFELSDKQEFPGKFYELSPEYQPCGRLSKEMAHEYVKEAFKTGYIRFEWVHQTLTREPIPTEITLVRIKHRGEYIVAGYARDLREYNAILSEMHKVQDDLRVARDAAEAASLAKSVFLANMSHEIRTPMNSIIGFSELAMDDGISPRTRDYLNKILESAEGLLQIINDILDISKVESGKMQLEHIPFDLHEVLSYCQTVIVSKAVAKGIQMHFYAEPSIGKKLLGDPTRLRQILINLLSNAVKFTNTGTVKMSSTVKESTENSVTLYFEVKDSGIGMTQEQISKVYEPFVQADSSMTRKYGGTGLGLPISRNLIELMGGSMVVESSPGIGSKFGFTLTFDTIIAPEETINQNAAVEKLEKPTFEGEILICEDNVMNQQVICEYLSRVGIKTVVAENGRDGVDMVRGRMEKGKKPFDLIFMDTHMPVMDGLEAASIINSLQTGTPIVAMTANIMSTDSELYKTNGMPDFLGKPFTSQMLWRCLMKYFTPVKQETSHKNAEAEEDMEMRRVAQLSFVKYNQQKFDEIANAIKTNDIKQAHRLAHALKSNAGQIGKIRLQAVASDLELALKDGENPVTEEQLKTLETEMNLVLNELAPLLDKAAVRPQTARSAAGHIDPARVRELVEKLEPLLKSGNPESLRLIGDFQAIPGSELLIRQIEDFDFDEALFTLAELKKGWK